MSDNGLLASSGTIEGIKKLIAEFYFTHINNIELIPTNKKQWDIKKGQNILSRVRVLSKGKRYRFEMV